MFPGLVTTMCITKLSVEGTFSRAALLVKIAFKLSVSEKTWILKKKPLSIKLKIYGWNAKFLV